jgi:hypothetical protein
MKTLTPLLACALLLGAGISPLGAQESSATVTGTVTNSSGAPVPNARVELENVATGQRLTVVADETGAFTLSTVPVGRYRIFSSTNQTAGTPAREIDIGLTGMTGLVLTVATGPVTDAIIQTEEPPIEMKTAQIAHSHPTTHIHYSPQSNFMEPGKRPFGAYNLANMNEGIVTGGIGAQGPVVAGQRPQSNTYHIDGIDNNNRVIPGPNVYVSNEATTNFALFQGQMSPEFGHAAGGKFNSIVRTGTNQFHGQLYNYLQNRHLNAMDASMTRLGLEENNRFDQNRLGGAVGFPIVPSKLFAFGNFEYIPSGWMSFPGGLSYAPTAAGFATLRGIRGVSDTNLGILENAVAGSVRDASRSTTVFGQTIPLGLVNTGVRSWMNQYHGTGSIDWNMAHMGHLRARYVHNESETSNAGAAFLPDFAAPLRTKSLLANVSHYMSFTPAVTNELRFGYNRYANYHQSPDATFPGLAGFPTLRFTDVNLGLGPGLEFANRAAINTYQVADTLAWTAGRHNLRFGFDGRRYLGSVSPMAGSMGTYAYSSLERFLLDISPDVLSERSFGGFSTSLNQWLLFGYIQDNWTVRPNLHINLGVRYQYAGIPEFQRWQRFNAPASVGGVIDFREPEEQFWNFAPHVGIAWSPSRLTAIRGGFTMVHDALSASSLYTNALVSPLFGGFLRGNLNRDTIQFLSGGGLRSNFDNGGNLTDAQMRAGIHSWFGDQDLPYVMQWNFGVQQGLWRNVSAEVKYLGHRGVHLPVFSQFGALNTMGADSSLPLFFSQPTQAQLNGLTLTQTQLASRPTSSLAQFGFTNPVYYFAPDGNSWYHGLAVSLRQRWSGGFALGANWTWSHLIDDTTGTPMDLWFGRQRGTSLYDRRHNVNATATWDVSGLFRDFGVIRSIFANFNLAGTYTFESPQYLTPMSSINAFAQPAFINNAGFENTATGVTALRNSSGQVVGFRANDPNARFVNAPFGTSSGALRNMYALDWTNNLDVSAVKRFSYRDKLGFEIRGDAYNVFNHSQFVGGRPSSIGFREYNFTPNFLVAGSEDFNNIEGYLSSNSRRLQVALRLTW